MTGAQYKHVLNESFLQRLCCVMFTLKSSIVVFHEHAMSLLCKHEKWNSSEFIYNRWTILPFYGSINIITNVS